MSAPAYATARNPKLRTFGARAAAVSAYLGAPYMPWQRAAADVALELDPYNPGAWRYPLVIISVPRQSGKTAWLRSVAVDRMMSYNRKAIMMTAQTGKDARKRWVQICDGLNARANPLTWKVHASQGSERLEYLRRRSIISPFAPTPKSLHGDTLPLVTVDEAWAFDEESGAALEAAINPTQLAVRDSQLIIVSTRGTSKSTYLNNLIEIGRAAVADPESRICYIEYSADPTAAGRDPYGDEALAFHPAIGYTQTAEKIRTLAGGSLASWRRSILNLPSDASTGVVDMAIWDSLVGPAPRPELGRVHIGYDVAQDGSRAAIVAAWMTDEGDVALDVIADQAGTGWLLPSLLKLRDGGYRGAFLADDAGPTRTVNADLARPEQLGGDGVRTLSAREYGTACQLILDKVRDGAIIHKGHEGLREALETTVLRPIGGAAGFDPIKSPLPISTLRAAAAAAFGVVHLRRYAAIQLY